MGLAGILQLRSGTHFSVNFSPTLAGWYANRADTVSSKVLSHASRASRSGSIRLHSPLPTPFMFGDSARNMLFGPGAEEASRHEHFEDDENRRADLHGVPRRVLQYAESPKFQQSGV